MRTAILMILLLFPIFAFAGPMSCQRAIYLYENGNDAALIQRATQLYEMWNDQAMAAGRQPVNFGLTGLGSDDIKFWMQICAGNPTQPFEEAVRIGYQMAQRMGNL